MDIRTVTAEIPDRRAPWMTNAETFKDAQRGQMKGRKLARGSIRIEGPRNPRDRRDQAVILIGRVQMGRVGSVYTGAYAEAAPNRRGGGMGPIPETIRSIET